MNSKSVLNKILTLLSLDEKEVNFTDAQTADGTILQSPTFDLGEDVEVVSEDGTKTKAPDGEHEIALRDSEGKEVVIRIVTKDGKIVERSNVEEANPEVGEDMEEEVVDKEADKVAKEDDVKMADAEMLPAKGLPNTTDEDKANEVAEPKESDDVISLSYRIAELEKMVKGMIEKMEAAEVEIEVGDDEEEEEDEAGLPENGVAMEEELPKLDGAPVEVHKPFNFAEQNSKNYGKKVKNSQSTFLSKLYS
jgi:hypothetical protein